MTNQKKAEEDMSEITLIREGLNIKIIYDGKINEEDFTNAIQDALKALTGYHYEVKEA